MIRIITELNIEVTKPNIFQAIVAKQYDMNSRFIKATLVDCGTRIDIPKTAKVVINAERKDGQSDSFEGDVNADGTVTVPLHSWMLELEGTVICDISVIDTQTDNEKKLTTTSFTLLVEKAAYGGDDVTSDPQYDVLLELIEQVENLAEEVRNTSLKNVDLTYNPESENAQSGKAVAEVVNNLASAIKNTKSGEAITVNDVSPVEHSLKVNVESKNLFNGLMEQGSFDTTTGEELTTDTNKNIRARSVDYIQVSKGTYTLSTAENWWFVLYVYDINGNYIANESKIDWWSSNIYTFTILGDRLIKFGVRRADGATFSINDIEWVQLELGSTATEYTPYDVNGVKISRYGKNLFDIGSKDDYETVVTTITVSNEGITGISGDASASKIFNKKTYKNGKYTLSMKGDNTRILVQCFDKEGNIISGSQINIGSGTYNSYYEGWFFQPNAVANVNIPDSVSYWRFGINFCGTPNQYYVASNIQIALADFDNGYEPYIEPQTATANADGTVNGLTSISPNMTLVTDTSGVVINLEYNADTKMYIDNKFAELATALLNS